MRKFTISGLSLNTLQFVILSRMDGLKINSIENLSGLKSSEGISLEAMLAKRSALAFWSLEIDEILNAMKCSVRSCTKD